MPTAFFISHADVAIDPAVAVPDWPLDGRGRERMRAIAGRPWARNVRRVFASSERKARDGAEILAAGLDLTGYSVAAALGEIDRSATGYLPRQEFEETADAFEPNALRLLSNVTQSSRTLPVISMLDRGGGGPDKTTQASSRFVQACWHGPLAVRA